MTDIEPGADRGRPWQRRKLGIGLVGLMAVASAALFIFGGQDKAPGITPGDGGGGTAMCIRFDLERLAQAEVAFDGTVTAVDGELVSFDVGNWYRGPGDASITLREPGLGGGVTIAGTLVNFQVRDRYLVSGSGGVVTSCGYSVEYSDAAAADWATAFGG